MLKRWLARLSNWFHSAYNVYDVEPEISWSITSRLASMPNAYLRRVPFDIACLITEAKQLHPTVAQRSKTRAVELERNKLGFVPRFHSLIECEPHHNHYALHPMMSGLVPEMRKVIDQEATRIMRAGAEIVNPFDQFENYTGTTIE